MSRVCMQSRGRFSAWGGLEAGKLALHGQLCRNAARPPGTRSVDQSHHPELTTDAGTSRRISRREVVLLLVILLAGVVLRVGISIHRWDGLVREGNGAWYIHPIAANLASGNGYRVIPDVPSVFQQPGYPFLLAAGYVLAGPTPIGVIIANSILSVFLMLAAYHLGRLLWGRPSDGLAAALATALYPYLAWHGTAIADTTLFTLCLTAWFATCLSLARTPSLGRAALLGFFIAAGMLTRPSMIPLVPFGYLFLLITWRSFSRWALYAAVSAGLAIILALPWCLRNLELTGEFPLIGTHGPEAMFFSNNDEAVPLTEADSTADAVCFLPEYRGSELDSRHYQLEATPEEAVRIKAEFVRRTQQWILENPGTFARLSLLRLGRIWDPRYHPTKVGERPAPDIMMKTWLHGLSFVPLLILALIGLVGLLCGKPTRLPALFLLSIIAVYSLAHATGAGYSRVRLPLDLLLIGAACRPLATIPGFFRRGRGAA